MLKPHAKLPDYIKLIFTRNCMSCVARSVGQRLWMIRGARIEKIAKAKLEEIILGGRVKATLRIEIREYLITQGDGTK
jgi:hypothetical protein